MYSVIPIITLREFVFTGVTAAQTIEVPIIKAMPMRRWRQATAQLRVKARTLTATDSTLVLRFRPVSLSEEDPTIVFVDDGTAAVDLTVTSTDAPPYLLSANIPFAGGCDLMGVWLRAFMGTSGGTHRATISSEVSARSRP